MFFFYILFQLRVEAKDGGNPAASATALVTINVLRNLFSPVFANNTYTATIFETQDLGSAIVRVVATDADTRVSTKYSHQQNNEVKFTKYFEDSVKGLVHNKRYTSFNHSVDIICMCFSQITCRFFTTLSKQHINILY